MAVYYCPNCGILLPADPTLADKICCGSCGCKFKGSEAVEEGDEWKLPEPNSIFNQARDIVRVNQKILEAERRCTMAIYHCDNCGKHVDVDYHGYRHCHRCDTELCECCWESAVTELWEQSEDFCICPKCYMKMPELIETTEKELAEIDAAFKETGHPLAPGETRVEKARNLAAIIKSGGELFNDLEKRNAELKAANITLREKLERQRKLLKDLKGMCSCVALEIIEGEDGK